LRYPCTVVNLRFAKPLDIDLLEEHIQKNKTVIIIEEGTQIGGVGNFIIQSFKHLNKPINQFHQMAIKDTFVDHGKIPTLLKEHNLTKEAIISKVKALTKEPSSIPQTSHSSL
jgi:1-deoxy-D-xylulose-5-phosphate synthase